VTLQELVDAIDWTTTIQGFALGCAFAFFALGMASWASKK
jgi:hypothetical protein